MGYSVQAVLNESGFEAHLFASAQPAVASLHDRHYDAALVDLDLPDRPGLWVVRELVRQQPPVPTAAFSASLAEERIIELLDAGASGYISKYIDPSELSDKVHALINGQDVYDAVAASRLISALRRPKPSASKLSPREIEALELMAHGKDTTAIAEALFISPHTVKDIVRQVFKKLSVRDRAAAVAEGFRLGYIK